MTVANQTVFVVHRGNGAAVTFPYNFRLTELNMVKVSLRYFSSKQEIKTLLPSEYSITGVNMTGVVGGSVTYPLAGPALTPDIEIVIEREVNYTQNLVLLNEGGFYPEAIEYQLDLIVFQTQQLNNQLLRILQSPVGVTPPIWWAMPNTNLIYVNEDNKVVESTTPPNEDEIRLAADEQLQENIDKKANHAVKITAGSGLVGGGDLSTNREISLSPDSIASLALADSSVQPNDIADFVTESTFTTALSFKVNNSYLLSTGTGLTGGGDLTTDREISLSSSSIASLELADTSIQPDRTISTSYGIEGGGDLSSDRSLKLTQEVLTSLDKADKAAPALRNVLTGDGLDGGGDLTADRTITLSQASTSSLALADSSVQPSDIIDFVTEAEFNNALSTKVNTSYTLSTGTGLTGGGDFTADRSISLSTAVITSLGKADSSVQPEDLGSLAAKDTIVVGDITAGGVASGATALFGDGTWRVPGGASGSMAVETYDPRLIGADVFSMANMTETPNALILTAGERTSIGLIPKMVRYDQAQSLTPVEQAQAKDNINADKTTMTSVGAALAGPTPTTTLTDGDKLGGLLSGGAILATWSWATVKASIKLFTDTLYASTSQGSKADSAVQPDVMATALAAKEDKLNYTPVNQDGGTMLADPTIDLGVATKRYVDNNAVLTPIFIESSGTWSKPTSIIPSKLYRIEAWGGGGGGGNRKRGGGGGGGAYNRIDLLGSDIPASAVITIGAGGNGGSAGGNSSFDSLLTANGGKAGSNDTGGAGGAGGTSPINGGAGGVGGWGSGGSAQGGPGGSPRFGAGGGGGGSDGTVGVGGTSDNDGGAGGGPSSRAGSSPGGGGTADVSGFAGARGEIRIRQVI